MRIIERTALFSPDEIYRYELGRRLEDVRWPDRKVLWIMLNPSTADEFKEDPTIRRCIGFSAQWGFGHITMVNIFAYRSPIARKLLSQKDPVGPENDYYILKNCLEAELIVAAWGSHGRFFKRALRVREMLPFPMSCFGVTSNGNPRHPLYLPVDAKLEFWRPREV